MIERVINTLAIDFRCRNFNGFHKNVDQEENLNEDVETVTYFSYLGERNYSGGGCESAVASRIGLGWLKLRDSHDVIFIKKIPLKIKGSAYKGCATSAMLDGM